MSALPVPASLPPERELPVDEPHAACRSDEALATLLTAMKPRLQGILASSRIPPQDAEDVLQDAMVIFLLKRRNVKNPEKWLLGVVKRRCLVYWRARRRQLWEAVDFAILEAVAAPGGAPQHALDFLRDLEEIIDSLPERQRELVKLLLEEEPDPYEVADRLGYARSGIHKVIRRARKTVRDRLVEERLMAIPPPALSIAGA